MSTDNNSDININLDTLDSTDALKEKELIFLGQYRLMIEKILAKATLNREQLQNQCNHGQYGKEDDEARGVPSCFFIDGSRGSGKSTLMRAVRQALVKGDEHNVLVAPADRLYLLADIDPTELGKGENFFLYLLGCIYKLLDECYKKNNRQDDEIEQIRYALEDLRKMSAGLQILMDSNGALKGSSNPDFFLEKCVEKCADSMLIRQRLNSLLDRVSHIVHRDVFLVCIDDADLNFSKCEDVLEYVRKYMQSPRLIFLFAGDMQLYSHIVRGMLIRGFDDKLFSHDTYNAEQRIQMLDHLEDQYLLKLFPSENRMNLGSFSSMLRNAYRIKLNFKSTWNGKQEEMALPFLNYYLSKVADKASMPILREFIGKLPLRSALYLLRYWYRATLNHDVTPENISAGVQQIALQSLIKHDVDYTALQGGELTTLIREIFRFYVQDIPIEKDLSLRPTGGDNSALIVCFYLSTLAVGATSPMYAKLAYFITMNPLWKNIRQKANDKALTSKSDRKNMVDEHLYFLDGKNYMMWAAKTSGYMAPKVESGSNKKRRFGSGTIRLMKEPQKRNPEKGTMDKISFSQLIKEITNKEFVKDKDNLLCSLAILHSICELKEGKESGYYLSIYSLISCATDLLFTGWSKLDDIPISSTPLKENQSAIPESLINRVSEKFSKMENPPISERHEIYSPDEEEDQGTEDRDKEVSFYSLDNINKDIIQDICQWVITYSRVSTATTSMQMNKWWTGFESRYNAYEKDMTLTFSSEEKQARAGELFLRYMNAFERSLSSIRMEDTSSACHPLSDCIEKFPLWKALKEALSSEKNKTTILLDSVNIGSLTNEKLVIGVRTALDNKIKAEQELENIKKRIEDFKRSLNVAEGALRPLREEREKNRKSIIDLERKSELREHEIISFNTRINKLQQIRQEHTKKISETEQELHANSLTYIEFRNSLQKTINEIAAKQNEYITIKSEIQNLKQSLSQIRLNQKNSTTKQQKDNLTDQELSILEQIQERTNAERAVKETITNETVKRKGIEKEIISNQRRKSLLDKTLQSLISSTEKGEKELQQVQKKHGDAVQILRDLSSDKKRLQEHSKYTEERYNDAYNAKKDIENDIEKEKAKLDQAERNKAKANRELEKAKK